MTAKIDVKHAAPPYRHADGRLETLALMILLACVAGRCFMGEVTFRTSSLKSTSAMIDHDRSDDGPQLTADRTELVRVTFAVGLLAAGAIWLLGGALSGRLVFRHGWLVCLVVVFAVFSVLTAFFFGVSLSSFFTFSGDFAATVFSTSDFSFSEALFSDISAGLGAVFTLAFV